MSQNSLSGGEVDIGGDEAAEFGVVVTALEIVEPCLFIRQSKDWWCTQ